MFLFDKKTRNVIKYIWGVFAIMIAFTMVFAFSGFTQLATPTPQAARTLTDEEVAALQGAPATTSASEKPFDWSTSSPEMQELLKSIEEDMRSGSDTEVPPAENVPALDFTL